MKITGKESEAVPQTYHTANESKAVPQTYHTANESKAVPQTYHTANESRAVPQTYHTANESRAVPQTFHIANESGTVPKAFYIKLECSTSTDDFDAEEMKPFSSKFVSSKLPVKDEAGVNLLYDGTVTGVKFNREEVDTTNWSDPDDTMHAQTFSNEKSQCQLCDADFAQAKNLMVHISVYHGQDMQTLSSQDSSCIGKRGSGINKHNSKDCNQADSYLSNLSYAKKRFSYSVTLKLRQHMQDEKKECKNGAVKSYKCTECNKTFTSIIRLKNHNCLCTSHKLYEFIDKHKPIIQSGPKEKIKHMHNGEKQAFTLRGYMKHQSKQPGTLQSHQCMHTEEKLQTGEKPYKCTNCDKAFTQLSSLNTHQRIHTGEKPYICTKCGKAFRHLAAISTHQHIHAGEKPYKCKDCGKALSTKSSLQSHQLIHTGVKT